MRPLYVATIIAEEPDKPTWKGRGKRKRMREEKMKEKNLYSSWDGCIIRNREPSLQMNDQS
jgi:hypothetical protein